MIKSLLSAVVAASCAADAMAATTATVELISRAADASTASANGASLGPVYSPDGAWVLFSSTAPDLVNLPGNGNFQLFAVNTTSGVVQLVSANSSGGVGNGGSYGGAMSADGRYVAFQSSASNLAASDTNSTSDVFVRDLTGGTTTLLSREVSGVGGGTDISDLAEISADGGTVVFLSYATNLVSGDTNQLRDVFAWKRADASVQLVSAGLNGKSVNAETTDFTLSADGRFVLFTAGGTNLTVAGKGAGSSVYLRDLQNGTTRWVSAPLTNLTGFSSNSAGSAVISANGRYVVMVAAPAAATKPALVRLDLNDDSVVVITNNVIAQTTYAPWFGPSISDDGQFVAYSNGTNVYHWTAASGELTRVDVTIAGAAVDGASDTPEISHDGKKVAFLSTSSDLVAGVVANGEPQIYVRDMVTGVTRLVTHSAGGGVTTGNEIANFSFNADDSALVFDSGASELAAMDNNDDYDVFSWDVASGTVSLVSQSKATAPSLTANGRSNVGRFGVSADGRFVAFSSLAQLTAKDTNIAMDAYVYDRLLKTNILVSAGPDGFSKGGAPTLPMISSNGTKVVFESASTGLAGPEDARTGTSVYVRDLQTGTLTNISGSTVGNLTAWRISDDGRYVFFTAGTQVHRYDLLENVDQIDQAFSPNLGSVNSSPDGSRVVYVESTSLFYRDFSATNRVRIFDGSTTPIALRNNGELIYSRFNFFGGTNFVTGETNAYSFASPRAVSMSADGKILAYQIRTVAGAPWEIWYLDVATGQTNLVSKAAGSSSNGNGDSGAPSVSADGRFIAFESWATDLVANDANGIKDVFVFDRTTGELSLVSHAAGSTSPGNSGSFNPMFAPAGSLLVFTSASSDMVAGDLNDDIDVFAATVDTGASLSDTDGDGLNDNWELAAFSTLTYGANDDPDGDGATNREEFLAGTNANSAASTFEALSIQVAADGSATLTFSSIQGEKYRVEFTASLTAPQWTTVGGEVTASAAGETTVTIPSAGEGYYRLRLVE